MARLFHFEFWDVDFVYKSIRQVISVFAWSWAILVFILSYFGRGHYNHVNNHNELAPPPLFQTVFVPVLKVLVVAPSAFGYPAAVNNNEGKPGSAGHHAAVQASPFLITNNENYGLEFTPYISPQQQQQQQKQQQWEMSSAQQRSSISDNSETGGQLCAGCLPLTNTPTQFRSQLPQGGQSSNANSNGGSFGYSVNLQQQSQQPQQWAAPVISQKQWNNPNNNQQQQWNAPPTSQQQQQRQIQQWGVAQQQTPTMDGGQLCAGCMPGGIQGQSGPSQWGNSGPGFGYSVNLQPQQRQQQQWGNQNQQFNQDPATVQHLQINDDGQYSFSYNAADSSRQEQRNLDGSVSGNYAYTDSQGKQVQVDYRASPNEGFRAFGPNIGSQSSVQLQIPVQVQDTPEVQAAKAQFFETYNRIEKELAAARALNAQNQKNDESSKVHTVYSANTNANGGQPESQGATGPGEEDSLKGADGDSHPANKPLESASDFKNLPEPIAVPDSNGLSHSEIDEDDEADNDAVVISSDDSSAAPSTITQKNEEQQQVGPTGQQTNTGGPGPNPAYQFSHVVGGQQQAVPVTQRGGEVQGQQWPQFQNQQAQWQQPQQNQRQWGPQAQQSQWQGQSAQGDNLQSGLPGYFYYVSVGGSPHYVTSNNLMRADVPTSLKAHLVGAIPADAVHDAQTPYNSQQQQNQNKVTPPVYVDLGKKPENKNANWNVQPQQQQSPFVFGFIPGTIVSFRNDGSPTTNNNKVEQGQGATNSNSPQILGYPLLVFKNK